MNASATRPAPDEHAPYYARYVDLVPEGDIVNTLREQMTDTVNMLARLSDQKANHRYAPDKWSIKEVIGHVIDSERVFAYRALRFARNDKTPLPGFEQDDYVAAGGFDARNVADLAREYEHVRTATIDLFASLDETTWAKSGTANEVDVSVRALAWIIAGHEMHHKEVLKEKYL